MANFVEIANSVVSLLEELQTKAEAEGEKMLTGAKQLETLGEQGKQNVKEVNEGLTNLENRVVQTRESLFKRLGEVKTKLAKLHFAVENFTESVKEDMSNREKEADNLDQLVEGGNSSMKSYVEDAVKEIDGARDSLNISNETMKLEFDRIEKHLEMGEGALDSLQSGYEQELRELTDLIKDRCIRATEVNTDRAIEESRESFNGWHTEMDETTDLLKEDLSTAIERIRTAEAESRADAQTIVDEAQQAYDGQQLETAQENMQEKTQELAQRLQSSRTNFDGAVDDFSELRDVMQKIVG